MIPLRPSQVSTTNSNIRHTLTYFAANVVAHCGMSSLMVLRSSGPGGGGMRETRLSLDGVELRSVLANLILLSNKKGVATGTIGRHSYTFFDTSERSLKGGILDLFGFGETMTSIRVGGISNLLTKY